MSSTGETGRPTSRAEALAADASDPLAAHRDLFVVDEEGPVYLDGNSLGRQPRAAAAAARRALEEWAVDLVGGWERWVDVPSQVGDLVGRLVGAEPGQVVLADSTTVNLYKLAAAALDARPGRTVVVADTNDFPTVRYVLQGLAARGGLEVRWLEGGPSEAVGGAEVAAALEAVRADGREVALVCLSAVNYRSGAVAEMAAVDEAARGAGALTLWDLSHAAGAVPVELDRWGADLAVGCTYKYLNGGPGAPAWLYVRRGLQDQLVSPVWGWWGQTAQFEMGPVYRPIGGVGRFLSGTPPVMGAALVKAGIEPLLAAGTDALWAKTVALVDLLAARVQERLVPLGARVASPGRREHRGGHLAVAHEHAWAAGRLLIERRLVVPDFRPPDVLRLAPVAIYTRFAEVWDAVEALAQVLASPEVRLPVQRGRVT